METPDPGRTPVILLTGFLGAGKTTMLLRWLREAPATGRRLGVIMNEFGVESVDSQLLARPGLPIEQVDGGCLCCADDASIGHAVNRLRRSGLVDYIVVETSGLADPDNVIDVLTDSDLLPHVTLQAVVTVVDGLWFARESELSGERVLARKQIEFAHVLALSKCDQLSEPEVAATVAALQAMNPRAELVKLPYGLPEPGILLGRPPAGLHVRETGADDGTETPHLHATYQSITWRPPVPLDRGRFEGFLASMNPREVPRAKGFVRFQHDPSKVFVFQSVLGHHFIEELPARPLPQPVMVLIGPALDAAKYQAALRGLAFGGRATVAI